MTTVQRQRGSTANPNATLGAFRAVLLLAGIFAVLCIALLGVLRHTAPCHALTRQTLASPDGAYTANKIEVVCNKTHSNESGIEVAIAERNNSSGRPGPLANVYAVAGAAVADVQIAWVSARELRIVTTGKHGAVTAHQNRFKDVAISYVDSQH